MTTDTTLHLGLADAEHCAGCGACAAVCSRGALTLRADHEGFLQPVVDAAKCIGCKRCATVCPVRHPAPTRTPLSVFAAQARDAAVRDVSSSGGIFTLLAHQVLAEGGVVIGAAFADTPQPWTVRHVEVTDEAGLAALRGSKYVQSNLTGMLAAARRHLFSGRRVLFVGTPCQTAAMSAYLIASAGASYAGERDRLLLVSLICHAAPSPRAWQAYVKEAQAAGAITSIAFRDKSQGWNNYRLAVAHADGHVSAAGNSEHPYLRAFLNELCNRRSCAHCASRELRTDDDLTLGDYWNVASRFPDFDDDLGTSLVLINSPRGEKAWQTLQPQLRTCTSDWQHAQAVNPALVRSTPYGPKRAAFFRRLAGLSRTATVSAADHASKNQDAKFHGASLFTFNASPTFSSLVTTLLQPPFLARLKVRLARLKNRLMRNDLA